jgi:hypothetical protein
VASICLYLSDPKSRAVFCTKDVASIFMKVIAGNPSVRLEKFTKHTYLLGEKILSVSERFRS